MKELLCSVLTALLMLLPFRVAAGVVDYYDYKHDEIYQIRTALGITTQIQLSPDEKILDYSTGFSDGWELNRRENVFYLKPKNIDVDTNMMVRTETNSYIFELKVVATDWRHLEQARSSGAQYKVVFRYPSDQQFASIAPEEQPKRNNGLETSISKERSYYFGYSYQSKKRDSWLNPVSAYDDGKFTYIRLNDSPELRTGNFPAVFGREIERGEDFVVNTTVEGNLLIIHGTYPYLVVRHGDNVVGLRRDARE